MLSPVSWVRSVRPLAIALVLVASGLATACRAAAGARTAVRCATEDLLSSVGAAAYPRTEQEMAWLHRAQVCDMGTYLVATPEDSRATSIYVLRKGTPLRPVLLENERTRAKVVFDIGAGRDLSVAGDEVAIMNRSDRRVVVNEGRSPNGGPIFTYAAYNASRRAWIEYVDADRDGTFDIRQTDTTGQPLKREVTVADRWLEMVQRDGKPGVVVGGRFMSVTDARAKAAAETKR
jgi:hypothetical protein